ncbi:hypothetical protein JTB14_022937 [Gonioctena quinquepunctata]|nr:hypothetical protein JTB14_022937 [Gonioctena quinquepunctata]
MVEIRKSSRTLPNSKFFVVRSTVSEAINDVLLPGTRSRRPLKDFESSSHKTKRRRIHHLLETTCSEEISLAIEMKLRPSETRDSAAIVKELCRFSPRRGTGIKKGGRVYESQEKVGCQLPSFGINDSCQSINTPLRYHPEENKRNKQINTIPLS